MAHPDDASDMAQPRDACVEVNAMQPPPPPQSFIDALGEENALFAAATCIQRADDGSPNGDHPRPERALADARMEFDSSLEGAPLAQRDESLERRQCAGWPYRPPTPYGGHLEGTPAERVTCSPDRSLCCFGANLDDTACAESWTECTAEYELLGYGGDQPIGVPAPSDECPQDIIDACPTALNGCHFLCQHI
ncbi:MAG: hypothetical protein ACI9U2_002105 [Bradymonadia bacterium]|jgi:hypothetical protein